MKDQLRRVLALVMSVMMLCGNLPITAIAETIDRAPVIDVDVTEQGADDGDATTLLGDGVTVVDVGDGTQPFANLGIMPIANLGNLEYHMEIRIGGSSNAFYVPESDEFLGVENQVAYRIVITNNGSSAAEVTLSNLSFLIGGTKPGQDSSGNTVDDKLLKLKAEDSNTSWNSSASKVTINAGATAYIITNGSYKIPSGSEDKDAIYSVTLTYNGQSQQASLSMPVNSKTLYFGYNLAVEGAEFPDQKDTGETFRNNYKSSGVDVVQKVYELTDGTRIMSNGTTGAGAKKYLHAQLYAEGDTATITSIVPDGPDASYGFIGWYDKKAHLFYGPKGTLSHNTDQAHSVDAIWVHLEVEGDEQIYDGTEYSVINPKFVFDCERDESNYEGQVDNIMNMAFTSATLTYDVTGADNKQGSITVTKQEYADGAHNGNIYSGEATIDFGPDSLPKFTDAGTYNVHIKGVFSFNLTSGDPVTAIVEKTVQVIIHPRPVLVKVKEAEHEYDGTAWTIGRITQQAEYEISTALNEYQTAFAGNTRAAKAIAAEKIGFVNGDGFSDQIFTVVYNGSDANEVLPGTYPATISTDYTKATKGDDLNMPKVVKSNEEKSQNYVYLDKAGELRITGTLQKLTIHKKVVGSTKGGTFDFTVAKNGTAITFVKDNALGYLESTAAGANGTVSVVVPEGSTEASVDVYVVIGANEDSVTCTVTEQLSADDAKKYEVSYSADGNSYTTAASQSVTLRKSSEGHVYVKNNGKYYVAHYLADLNDAGDSLPKSTEAPLADEGYAHYITETDAYVMTDDITYADVHARYEGTQPTGWSFSDQHIYAPNSPSADGKDNYTLFMYAVKGTMKNVDYDVNGEYLEAHTGNVEPGDTVKVYWDRILENAKEGDGRNVTLDKTATNLGKVNSIRQSKIVYATEYELWTKIQGTTGNSGIPNLEAKDTWQYTNAIDLMLTNSQARKYIFHTVLAQQVKSYVAPKGDTPADEKDYSAITIDDTEIVIDNLKGGTNDTKVYLVPLIKLDYYIDGKPANVTDDAEYTVDVENVEAAGDRNSATNSNVGTKYLYNYTPATAPTGNYYTESDWKLRTHAAALATELTDMSANKLAKSDLYAASNGGLYVADGEGYLQVQLHHFTYTIEKTVKIMRPNDDDPDQLTEVTGSAKAGDQLVYTVTVTNNAPYAIEKELTDEFKVGGETETLTLEGAGLSGNTVTVPAAEYELVNGLLSEKQAGTVTLTATYTVKDDDVESADNKVTIKDGPSDEVTTEIEENPKWEVEKTAVITHNDVNGYCGSENTLEDEAHVGDKVSYVIKVTNTGNTELTLTLTDQFTATNALSALTNDTTNGGVEGDASSFTLQIGEFIEFTAEYTVVTADDQLVNKATATDEDGNSEEHTVTTDVRKPSWTVEKSVSGMTGGFIGDAQTAREDDILTYTITVTNTGNVTPLEGLILTDTLGDLTNATVTGGTLTKQGDNWVLDMTEDEATITYQYTVKSTDIGQAITNTATVEAGENAPKDPTPNPKHSDSTATETEGWSIVKKLYSVNGDLVDENGQIDGEDVKIMVGDTVQYVLQVENKGSVVLNDLTVTDTLSGLLENSANQPSFKGLTPDTTGASYANDKLSNLGVGETVGLIFEYEVQDGDAFLSNSAEASKPKYKDDKSEDTSKDPDKDEDGPVENVVYCMLTVNKVWMEQDGTKAIDSDVLDALLGDNTITIEVYRDGEDEPVASVTMPQAAPADKWSETFGPLPLADADGNSRYTYKVVERGADDDTITLGEYTYDVSVEADEDNAFAYHVTNTLQDTDEEDREEPVKEADPQTADKKVEIGDYIKYTITHTSPMATTTTATITDELPTGLAFAGEETGYTTVVTIKVNGVEYSLASDKVTENESNGTITWTIEDVPPMADIEIVFYAKVTSDAATITGDTLDNKATVKQENKSGGKYEETTDEVKVPVKKPDLSITKIAKDENGNELVGAVVPGQTFTYVITVTNNGEGKATGIKVQDTLSNYLMYEGYTATSGSASIDDATKTPKGYGGVVTWTFDELASGASATLTIKVTLYATARGHVTTDKTESQQDGNDVLTFDFVPDFDNTATIEAGDKTKDEKEKAEKHVDVADFIIQKDVKIDNASDGDPDVAELGDGIDYTITVQNVGGIALKDFTLTDDMFENADAGSMKVKIDGVDVAFTASGNTITIAGPLDVGKEAIVTYTRTVTPELIYEFDEEPEASIENTVKAKAKYTDPDSKTEKDTLEHENSIDVTLADSARGWLVEKEVSGMSGVDENGKPFARVGDVLTYTIRVTNKGNVVLHRLNLADTLTIDTYTANLARLLEKDEAKSNTDALYVYESGNSGRIEAADPEDPTSGLRPGETIVLTYTRTANPVTKEQLGDDVVNTVTVTHPTARNEYKDPTKDPDEPNDPTWNPSTATVTTPIENYGVEKSVGVMKDGQWVDLETAGLVLDGESDEEGVPAGTVLVYHITVTNESDFELHDILVTDKFGDADVDWNKLEKVDDASTAGAEYDATTGKITKLPANGHITLSYTYTVLEADAGKTLKNAVTVGTDKDTPVDTDEVETEVDAYEVAKSVTRGTVDNGEGEIALPGTKLTYSITIKNTGKTVLNSLVVTDTWTVNDTETDIDWNSALIESLAVTGNKADSDVDYEIDATDSTKLIVSGIAVGETATITYTVVVPKYEADGRTLVTMLKNAAVVNEGGGDPHETDEVTTPVGQWSISKELTLVDDAPQSADNPIKAGKTLTYTVTVKNEGEVDLYDLEIADTLTINSGESTVTLEYLANSVSAGHVFAGGKLDVLSVGETVTLQYTYDVQDADMFLNNVSKATKTGDPEESDDPDDPDNPDDPTDPPSHTETSNEVKDPVYRDLDVLKVWKDSFGNQTLSDELLAYLLGDSLSIKVELLRGGNSLVPAKTLTLDAAHDWKGIFENLPATDGEGNPYTYSVKESEESGTPRKIEIEHDGVTYTFEVSGGSVTNEPSSKLPLSATLTNTIQNNEPTTPTKEASVDSAEMEDKFQFTIKRKSHVAATTTATITDALNEYLAYVETVSVKVNGDELEDNQYSVGPKDDDDQTIIWTIPNVPPMADIEVVFTVKVTDEAIKYDEMTNTATVELGDDSDDDYTTDPETVDVKLPKLKITKTANVQSVQPGGDLEYTLVVENFGDGLAKGVKVEDELPPYLDWDSVSFVPANANVTGPDADGKITWTIDKLASNNTATLTIKAQVNGDVDDPLTDEDGEYVREFTNVAIITDGMAREENGDPKTPDPDENRSDDETTKVADVDIVKTSTDDADEDDQGVKHYKDGDKITYTLTVTNIGGATLSDVKVSDGMFEKADKNALGEPDLTVTKNGAATGYDYENGVITLTDPLAAENVVVITYVYTITQTDLDTKGSIPNVAKVNGKYPKTPPTDDTPDPEPDGKLTEHQDDDKTVIPSEPSLTVKKELLKVNGEAAAAGVHVKANDVLTYQITVTNTGNVTLTLNVQDLFQGAEVALTATGANAGLYDATTKTISGLAPQASITFEYTYNAVKGADAFLKNAVTVTGRVPKNPEDLAEGYFDLEESDTVANVVYRDLKVTKIWTDGNGEKFDPDLLEALIGDPTIIVALYRSVNGGEAAEVPGVPHVSLNKDNNWTATFSDLPAATDDGYVYTYEVREIGETKGEAKVNNLTFGVTYGTVGGPDADGLMDASVTNKLKDADKEYDTDKTADEDDPATGANDGVEIGDTITYTVTRQSHLSTPSKATIIDVLPEGLDYDVESAELKVTVNGHEQTGLTLRENVDGQTVTWTVENVPPMATVTITYTVTVNADAIKYEELENDAKVGFGDDPTDESIFKGDSDTVEVLRPELVITKLANVDTVKPGTEFQYTLTVVNHGEGRAEAVEVEDLLPEHVTFKSCDPSDDVEVTTVNGRTKLTWKVGDLSNEEDGANTAKLTVTVTVNQDEDGYLTDSNGDYVHVISNTATITKGTTPLDPDDPVDPDDPDGPYTSTFETNVADLRIEKTGANEDESKADSDIYMAGDKYVYTIVVENIGNVDLTNVTVADTRFDKALMNKDYGITVVLTTADGEEEILSISPDANNVLTIETLKVGELVTIHYVYEITLEDLEDVELHVIKNTATTKGTYKTSNPEDPEEPEDEEETNEHSDTDELPVDAVPALDVKKSVTGMSGKRGKDAYARLNDVLTYTVIVTNTGNVTLNAVEVEDDMFRVAVDGVVMVSVNGGAAKKATVKDNKIIIAEIPVGEAAKITYSYVVTQQDILNGHVYNKVTADADDPHDKLEPKSDDEDVDTDEMHSELKLLKRVAETSRPKNGEAFVEGETVTFEIVVTNDGNVTRMGDVIDELLSGATFVAGKGYEVLSGGTKAKIAKLDPNESITLTAVYTVKQQDVVNGSLLNVVVGGDGTTPNPGPDNTPAPTPTNSDGTSPTPTPKPSASVEVTPEKPNPLFTITKAVVNVPANGEKFTLNETIKYEITVTNTGNVDLTDVTIKDQLKNVVIVKSSDYTVIEGGVIIKSMPVGATVTIKATYVVTEADILAGSVENVAVGSATGPYPDTTPTPDPNGNTPEPGTTATPIPVPDPTPGVVETDTVPKRGHLTLEKEVTNTPESGEGYALGETITYSVKVTNDGNLTITDIVVTDELTGGQWTVPSLKPGESKTFTTAYVVTEADVLAGSVLNVVTAKGKSPDPENPDVPVDPDEVESPTEPRRGHLSLEKVVTSTPENGIGYALDETITYEVKVTNDGNLTITDIVVTDELTGGQWTVKSLKPGESKTFTTSYVVTQSDVLAGSVLNVATAKGKSPDPENPDVPTDPAEVESPTEPNRGHLTLEKTVTSTPANGKRYVRGETITYEIKVINDGNLTITDIVVNDDLTGGQWTIASLKPGESKTFTTSHVVTEEDILAGRVLNVATAKGKSPDPENPDVPTTPGETESETTRKYGHLTVTKEVTNTPADGSAYGLGETITYIIRVVNSGNLTLTNVVVTDELTGGRWVIASLAPWETRYYTTSYVVTQADLAAGYVLNVATAKGTSPDPDHPNVSDDSDEVISPTKKPRPDGTPTYKLTKTETNLPDRGYYLEGETVEYTINVLNTSTIAIIGFVLTDQLNGATVLPGSGYTVKSQNQALIDRLRPGQSVDVKVSYKVTKEDMKRGNIRNVASGTGTGSNGRKAEGNVTEVTVPTNEDTYDLTIHYYYLEDGSEAAPDYVLSGMKPSEDYDVLSPGIEGFWTLTTRVSGKMPARNVEITVFYVPDSMTLPGLLSEVEDMLKSGMTLVLLDEYGVPMGIGSVTRNVGDCFE